MLRSMEIDKCADTDTDADIYKDTESLENKTWTPASNQNRFHLHNIFYISTTLVKVSEILEIVC